MRDKPVIKVYKLSLDNISFLIQEAGLYITGDEISDFYFLPNKEGHTRLYLGDYIIRNNVNEFYVCKKEVFEKPLNRKESE